MTNPLLELKQLGQSVWLDYIRRDLITSGELKQLIDDDGLVGVTSNPAIFEKAITSSDDYDAIEHRMSDRSAQEIFEAIAFEDVQMAADVFKPVYAQTDGGDGYVSIEVPASLAHQTDETIKAAKRYWESVNRPNIMVKIPATKAGVPAIAESLAYGININITLIFSVTRYLEVAEAYVCGLEQRAQQGLPVSHIASVASFFVSRVDTLVDKLLDQKLRKTSDAVKQAELRSLMGQIAIANSKLAYREYQKIFGSERFAKLRALGARPQRVLWASTSTKNPKYPDTYYVDELIGAETVNTLPPDTLKLFREHGKVRPSLTEEVDDADVILDSLAAVGIDRAAVAQQLEDEGVKLFDDAYNKLLKAIEAKKNKS
jgi:transaldolase